MPFQVLTPLESDAPAVAALHLRAMRDNLLVHAQLPTAAALGAAGAWLAADTVAHIRRGDMGVLVAREDAAAGGAVVGFAKWFVRRAGGAEEEEVPAEGELEGARREYFERYVERTGRMRGEVVGDAEYYHPTYICTDPDFERRGVGSLLLSRVKELAAGEDGGRGLPVVLEATMEAVGFYERNGFEVVGGLELMLPEKGADEPTVRYEEKCMVWTPGGLGRRAAAAEAYGTTRQSG
ncbi:hypothetical protein ESCO_003819 [Escovopsis weberi]|uniref:N-acetyltransferase domain-containing protein n=1 Tax=Escovopsis weberi TaxID=150374 RepID=A0A0M8MZU1_ESCWE|nr:hypothetical protein ESCO_003819 [Escovopsis weberi]